MLLLVGLGLAVAVLGVLPLLWWVLRPAEPKGFPLDDPAARREWERREWEDPRP